MRKFLTADGDTYSSFLECISSRTYSIEDINPDAIAQFLVFGCLYFDETFVKGITKEFTHQEITLASDKGFIPITQGPENPLTYCQVDNSVAKFLTFFEKRASHLKQKEISIDLTGGIDSRLIATILHHYNIPFDAAFSLGAGVKNETNLVKQVATSLGKELHILKPTEVENEKDLEELFQLSDGLWDILALKSLHDTQKWRKEKGYNIVLTGVGGELYKDFFWQQDFPFYTHSAPNISKLVTSRMYPLNINIEWLKGKFRKAAEIQNRLVKQRMKSYLQQNNTYTYDQIYYHVRIKEQVSVITNASKTFIDSYSPLLENELIEIGYNLPRSKRFFNRFHREIISSLNPEVAKIPTTEGGMTVSNNGSDISTDLVRYGITKSLRLYAKYSSSRKQNEDDKNKLNSFIKNEIDESLKILKDVGVLSVNSPQNSNEINPLLSARLLLLGMLIRKL